MPRRPRSRVRCRRWCSFHCNRAAERRPGLPGVVNLVALDHATIAPGHREAAIILGEVRRLSAIHKTVPDVGTNPERFLDVAAALLASDMEHGDRSRRRSVRADGNALL